MNVAIIPARGGSKRIPRKNIKLFCGKPMIGYSIDAALKTGLFDRVIVSTDDKEIADIAVSLGAEVPFLRPDALADDFTGTGAVIKHALTWLNAHGVSAQYVCCIYATAPFLLPELLREGYDKLLASKKSFAFSITTFPFPIQRAIKLNQEGLIDAFFPEFVQFRSQDLEASYHDAGQFYWGLEKAFLDEEPSFSPISMPVIVPRYLVQDIDTMEDWHRAELMYRAYLEFRKTNNA